MNQRKPAFGRPSGTDGYDYSYRMVVDSRYQKVAAGKSRLRALFLTQVVIQLMGIAYLFTSSQGQAPNNVSILTLAIGFISLLAGELGRRKSRVSFLKLYVAASSIAQLLVLASIWKSNYLHEVIQDPRNWDKNKGELFETSRILLGSLLHIFTVWTVVTLIGNMSPPKRTS